MKDGWATVWVWSGERYSHGTNLFIHLYVRILNSHSLNGKCKKILLEKLCAKYWGLVFCQALSFVAFFLAYAFTLRITHTQQHCMLCHEHIHEQLLTTPKCTFRHKHTRFNYTVESRFEFIAVHTNRTPTIIQFLVSVATLISLFMECTFIRRATTPITNYICMRLVLCIMNMCYERHCWLLPWRKCVCLLNSSYCVFFSRAYLIDIWPDRGIC